MLVYGLWHRRIFIAHLVKNERLSFSKYLLFVKKGFWKEIFANLVNDENILLKKIVFKFTWKILPTKARPIKLVDNQDMQTIFLSSGSVLSLEMNSNFIIEPTLNIKLS